MTTERLKMAEHVNDPISRDVTSKLDATSGWQDGGLPSHGNESFFLSYSEKSKIISQLYS